MSNEQRHVHVRKLPLRPSQNGARHCAQPGRLELSGTEAGEGGSAPLGTTPHGIHPVMQSLTPPALGLSMHMG